MTFLRMDTNEYGTPVSVHQCQTCDREFTVCPAAKPGSTAWDHCMADECASYDPSRDADVLFMSPAEIAREKPLVSIEMLNCRKAGVIAEPIEATDSAGH